MVFCFPCKSLGKNFKEDNAPPKPTEKKDANVPAQKEQPSAATPAPAVTTNGHTNGKTNGKPKSGPKIAIVIYSLYGHIATSKSPASTLCYCPAHHLGNSGGVREERYREGWRSSHHLPVSFHARESSPFVFSWLQFDRIPETLSQEILTKMHAPPKPSYPIITPDDLVTLDGLIMGIPTRYGNFPAQWKVC